MYHSGYNIEAAQSADRFHDYIKKVNLGPLEDVRDYVEMHCMENATDADDMLECAIHTLKYYLDCADEAKEVFDGYRK